MALKGKKEFAWLLLGDVGVFAISLWLTLAIRNLQVPENSLFISHLAPFSLLFVVWALVFFIAGLYDRYTLLIKSRLPSRLLTAHTFNVVIAIIFFYSIPYFGISPKITLFLYLLISSAILFFWRLTLYGKIVVTSRTELVVLATGSDVDYLCEKVKAGNSLFSVSKVINPADLLASKPETVEGFMVSELQEAKTSILAVDLYNKDIQTLLPILYSLLYKGVRFINVQDLYEETTDKVPLGLIDETWFLKHASIEPDFVYGSIKRLMDIGLSLPLFAFSLLFYPFVWIGMKLEDGGALFYTPERIGEGGKRIKIYKFRTMSVMDAGNQLGQNANKITKLGKFMRVTRIDELPQLWNILNGDLSLIGPRPEFPNLVELYNKEIPHYNVRHFITPGLSGWAQIHHEKPPHTVEETVEKLAYDLYYIKHRSLLLDVKIALQTIKTLLSRVGV
ncbi:MAG TPA: sugar transferase [Candidatus Paceibacterota bacterium]